MDISNKIEIRGFMKLDSYLRKKYSTMPFYLELKSPISALTLSKELDINTEDIEVVFINGLVKSLDELVQPGDRVAFLPPGCPGPYRIALGFYGKAKKY